jgi:hypothetical protein
MAGRAHLTLDDVQEVLRDMAQESEVPFKPVRGATDLSSDSAATAGALDLDLSRLGRSDLGRLSAEIAAIGQDQPADRLARLEAGLQRMERINLQTLALMQQLVDAMARSAPGNEKEQGSA